MWEGAGLGSGRLIRAFILVVHGPAVLFPLAGKAGSGDTSCTTILNKIRGDACVHKILGRAGIEDCTLQNPGWRGNSTPGRRVGSQNWRRERGVDLRGCNGGLSVGVERRVEEEHTLGIRVLAGGWRLFLKVFGGKTG